ncbi:N-acetylmuramoyl-L-alanine amidase CwlD [Virgibacillus halodenitrificans]|uniref:N-acetylmuramoyl-L-alanine amidase CwlD n=1 Tax=Virgibacillus halodenitrificans TaxID=1482 RepID=UPI0024BF210B|nr:N-acetylmuramoyl-L-alanine amidase CwlD [Virgibacillus halodenitrificans]WHX25409.1 N-acetylmuramoyl-L-alanine amidase CwlD [Virgibacillus halodenitrificans]
MNKKYKWFLWGLGFFVLVTLVVYPVNKKEMTQPVSWTLPLSGKTIVIDPGHGGADGGAVGKDQTLEKDISLQVSKKLQSYLQQSGAIVYLTREEDKDLADEETKGLSRRKAEDIRNRLKLMKEKDADFFVTIHLNALPSTRWSGAQTFYYSKFNESKHLAKMIQAEITRNLENTTRQALAIDGIYLLKHADIPGALVEIGFLSNEQERELLKQEDYQQKMSASIYKGILRFITEEAQD